MKKSVCLSVLAIAGLASVAGCPLTGNDPDRAARADITAIQSVINADVADEGVAVSRSELQEAFRGDPELLSAVLSDLEGSAELMSALLDGSE